MAGINEQIKGIISSENISQTELAKRMGCTRQNINDKLNDGNMYLNTAVNLLEAIGYRLVIQKI
ncbi:helix-turn-helix domain-containing protein [Parablautia intestinalis]|uniref:helix-turn-helix domain-containing protein n=1 Tax=Parablautia intestinalis TaxID=2320100 RepID=UPI002ED5C6F4